ncbi:DUF2188 domain-containing protein [Agromyces sp. NPDC058484]|uniref:DUF2188 domain-containing protein n=1 Tax=Agromyces sp. NPDC058484 TaxID=3346524 RepID=UPI00365DAC64
MTGRKTYDATARKDGRWWLVQVPELDTVGQARSAAEIEDVAREVIGLWLDVEPNVFDVNVSIEIPGEARAAWEESKARDAVARQENAAAAALARRAVQSLRADGLTFRDAGIVLGLSPQRVQQLAASAEAESEPVRVEEVFGAVPWIASALPAMEFRAYFYYIHGGRNDNNRYVFPNAENGGWEVVKASGPERTSAHFATKDEAITNARDIVENSARAGV